jgi:hypothetical protein
MEDGGPLWESRFAWLPTVVSRENGKEKKIWLRWYAVFVHPDSNDGSMQNVTVRHFDRQTHTFIEHSFTDVYAFCG